MNIKWAYYLIAVIYIILIVLRVINYANQRAYEKENSIGLKAFTIKKDFFTTVATICILVTLGINLAASLGGKDFNTSSILVTCLVVGFTVLNSFTFIRLNSNQTSLFFLGYSLEAGDVEKVKCKKRLGRYVLYVTFTREIESYNYAKIVVYGKHREEVAGAFEKLKNTVGESSTNQE